MNNLYIGNFNLYQLIWYFFIYAFLGWISEVVFAALKTGKFVNRGFLNGPVCPIYGFGIIIILLALDKVKDNLFVLFFASFLLTSVLEFLTGFILEKFFHKKWWDYSKEILNIKGYVCVRFSLIWAIACIFVINLVQPLIFNLVEILPEILGAIILTVFIVVFVLDFSFTVYQILQFSKNSKTLEKLERQLKKSSNKLGESVAAITLKAQEKWEKLNKKIKSSRLIKAFPSLHKKSDKSAFDNTIDDNEDNKN